MFTSDHQKRWDDNLAIKLENKVSFIFSLGSPVGLLNLLRRFSEDGVTVKGRAAPDT